MQKTLRDLVAMLTRELARYELENEALKKEIAELRKRLGNKEAKERGERDVLPPTQP